MKILWFTAIITACSALWCFGNEDPESSGFSWEPLFFEGINEFTAKVDLTPLRDKTNSEDSLEIRVWSGFGLGHLRGVVLQRTDETWTAFKAEDINHGGDDPYLVYEVSPHGGWNDFITELMALGIMKLPDSSLLPDEVPTLDGIAHVVEVRDGENYRTYMYSNPRRQIWPEAKSMVKIVEMLNEDLIPSAKPQAAKSNRWIICVYIFSGAVIGIIVATYYNRRRRV